MFLVLEADCFGSEITWELGTTGFSTPLFSGGPYTDQSPNGETITEEFCLANDCYEFKINDSYGDGMATAGQFGCSVDGDYNINDFYGNNFVTMGPDPDYGTGTTHTFCVTTVGIDDTNFESSIGLYPNPVEDQLNVVSNSSLLISSIEVLDVRGAIVLQLNNINTASSVIDFSSLAKGVYAVRVKSDEGIVTRKIIKK